LTPGAEDLEAGGDLRVERRRLALGGPPDAEGEHQAVDRQRSRARDLGDAAAHDPAVEVHLPEPVLRVAEALGEEEVGVRGGPHVRHSPAVAPDGDGTLDAVHVDRALRLRQRAACEAVPGRAERGRADGGDSKRGQKAVAGRVALPPADHFYVSIRCRACR
jgi:hypothetical protein